MAHPDGYKHISETEIRMKGGYGSGPELIGTVDCSVVRRCGGHRREDLRL